MPAVILGLFMAAAMLAACAPRLPSPESSPSAAPGFSPSPATPVPGVTPASKWDLWATGTRLRGANIYQRRVYAEVDGTEFLGPGPFGPPYTQADFDRLAALGANYVNISGSGLFTFEPPYRVDEEAVAHLDRLLEMAAQADLFAVITFRSGPGRSEFAITGPADWLPDEYLVDTVWQDAAARTAWGEMWRFTAERYRANPVVVGYDLMCEPNSNAGLNLWDAETFYAQYTGTGYDWNSWYPDLVQAIRSVDADTPILIGANSYSDITWLPYLQTVDDPRVVYTFHQYSPHEYTHQDFPNLLRSYPGYFDTDYDNTPETFERAWLENRLSIAADFQTRRQVVLAVNEFGVVRWVPGGAAFVRDEMALFDEYGWNYAAWQWHASWEALAAGDNSFNFLFGNNPLNLTETPNELLDAYQQAWAKNALRPSMFEAAPER
jgi:hypothetical protein